MGEVKKCRGDCSRRTWGGGGGGVKKCREIAVEGHGGDKEV